MQTKNEIALETYGEEFADLSAYKRGKVTALYNEQDEDDEDFEEEDTAVACVTAEVGRVGHNGTKKCMLPLNSTIKDMLDQAGYVLDERKEKIIEQSTGDSVNLTDEAEDGEVYVIAPEVKSA